MQSDHGRSRQGEGKSEKRPEWWRKGYDKIKMRLKNLWGWGQGKPCRSCRSLWKFPEQRKL